VGHDVNHGVVLEERIDLAQSVGPQLVVIGQQNFEQTSVALSSLHHACSFDQQSRAGSLVRRIGRPNCRIDCFVTARRWPSVPSAICGAISSPESSQAFADTSRYDQATVALHFDWARRGSIDVSLF
jgi:hypothetical protein